MKPRVHDPRRLDVAALADDVGVLEGRWPLAGFTRLADDHPDDAPPLAGDVAWRVRGERRAAVGEPQRWLHLACEATLHRRCQRCLQPVALALQVQRALRFVADEVRAAELDADSDDDVLALERSLDLHALVEDELLLALPMVPRHERCEPALAAGDAGGEAAPHAFAALARLRRGTAQ